MRSVTSASAPCREFNLTQDWGALAVARSLVLVAVTLLLAGGCTAVIQGSEGPAGANGSAGGPGSGPGSGGSHVGGSGGSVGPGGTVGSTGGTYVRRAGAVLDACDGARDQSN